MFQGWSACPCSRLREVSTHTHTHTHARTHARTRARARTHTHTNIHTYMYVCICMYVCVYIYIYIYIVYIVYVCMYMYVCMYIYIYIYIYVIIYTWSRLRMRQQPEKEIVQGFPPLLGVSNVCVNFCSPKNQFSWSEYAVMRTPSRYSGGEPSPNSILGDCLPLIFMRLSPLAPSAAVKKSSAVCVCVCVCVCVYIYIVYIYIYIYIYTLLWKSRLPCRWISSHCATRSHIWGGWFMHVIRGGGYMPAM